MLSQCLDSTVIQSFARVQPSEKSSMACQSTVELRDLKIETQIGTYGPGDTVPNAHLLDMFLSIDSNLVLIAKDGMQYVFDYDPLIVEVIRLAGDCHYATQERLMTRIAEACAMFPEIKAVEIGLRKAPVRAGTGSLGIRLFLDDNELGQLRKTSPLATDTF